MNATTESTATESTTTRTRRTKPALGILPALPWGMRLPERTLGVIAWGARAIVERQDGRPVLSTPWDRQGAVWPGSDATPATPRPTTAASMLERHVSRAALSKAGARAAKESRGEDAAVVWTTGRWTWHVRLAGGYAYVAVVLDEVVLDEVAAAESDPAPEQPAPVPVVEVPVAAPTPAPAPVKPANPYSYREPLVHLNGSSKASLKEEYSAAHQALRDAIEALPQPHDRDYYVYGDGSGQRARDAVRAMSRDLERMLEAVGDVFLAVDRQGRQS